ncbi:type VI secretion system membrane subunit TssM [Massilia sp. CCM 8695]|uniref:Type VI secretion system membrane subunit TssM n=2 Tax=Massilia TaxID=149698 RepID=A0ABX0NAX0_9BURK|nr:type VI secretion system membrane subunit TssM [Massilia frigida]NHZ82284.1 type VI secretion system membrane subunit TssM [Massilia frigida]
MNVVMNLFGSVAGVVFGRQLWIFFGLLALCCMVWLLGPIIAIGQMRPLESELARWCVIGLVFAIWLLRALYRNWRAARLNSQLLRQIRTPTARANAAPVAANPHLDELSQRFQDASEKLRTARFATDAGQGKLAFLQRFSGQYLYQLPWYVFIGAPGSGKTTALVNAGLEFPLAEQFGKAAIRGIGGTRNCDWWFTNEAVLIDTAGRYTMQESHREHDQGEWQGFVDLLKKFRPRQPLNGAILTISIADLLGSSEQERALHALTLRKRLHELRDQLGIQFPVYVLITKVDLLAGFTEYFAQLSKEQRSQVWGLTFKLDAVRDSSFDVPGAFSAQYKQLLERLYASLPEQLLAEHDPRQRELAYLLPQEFAGLEGILSEFLAHVFVSSKFESNALLRGVYFTSGTQEGTVFDRVLGGIKNFLQINTGQRSPQIGEPGRSFFLRSLLQDIIFKEAGLAGINERWQKKQTWLRAAGYAATAVLAIAISLAWLNSYRANQAYVNDVAARLPALEKRLGAVKLSDREQITTVMPMLDALHAVPVSTVLDVEHPALGYQLGLYQGGKLQAASTRAYERALDDMFLPQLARRLEDSLRQAPSGDVELSYNALKVYLMLFDQAHYDADFLQAWLSLDLERQLGKALSNTQRDELRAHLKRLLAQRIVASPFAIDEPLVAQTRERLLTHTLAQRAYGSMKRMLQGNKQLPTFNVGTVVGPQAPLVFRRASGASLNQGVAGLYSYRGYWELFAPGLDARVAKLAEEEKWVLAQPTSAPARGDHLAAWSAEVRRLYLTDYIRVWEDYLGDLRLKTGGTLAQNIQVARILSSTDSPLVRVMNAAARETTLVRLDEINGATIVDKARDKLDSTRSSLSQIFGQSELASGKPEAAAAERVEMLVDTRFAALREFTTARAEGSKAPIEGIVETIGELYAQLTATETALRDGATPPPNQVLSKILAEAGRLPTPFRGMLGELANSSGNNVTQVLQQQLGKNVAANVGHYCQQSVAGRYPFVRGSSRDMALGDFAQLFAPGALMDEFFQKNLANQVDTAVRPWRFKGEQKARAGYLDSFEQAVVIRDVYFAGGARTPTIRLDIKPVRMDASIAQFVIDIDGQAVRYAHGPQVSTPVQWPGPAGRNQVRVQLTGSNGSSASLMTEGAWALHRMFDRASLAPQRDAEKMLATFDVNGAKAVFEVTASSARNPFRLAQLASFSCPGGV